MKARSHLSGAAAIATAALLFALPAAGQVTGAPVADPPLGSPALVSSTTKKATKPRSEDIDRIFATWDKKDSPGCALTVIKEGKVLYSRGYGRANLEYDAPIHPDKTIFHVASTSKQFTAFAVHLLAREGKLSLDDDVRKYLPELHDFGKKITISHLMHHTSGLRDQWNLLLLGGWRIEDVITEEDILRTVWRQRDLNFEPGSRWLYCNTGYTLLGQIVKRVSGKSLPAFCQERIFTPLNMKDTHFHDDCHRIVPGRASSYSPRPGGEGWQNNILSFSNVGATSLFTTAQDLIRWDQNFYDRRVGSEAMLTAMQATAKLNDGKDTGYGSGLMIGEYRGLRTVEHGGADAGYRCTLLRFPDQKFSVVLLSNVSTSAPSMLARKVADLYLSDQLKPVAPSGTATTTGSPTAGKPVEVKIDPKMLDVYAGDYELTPVLIGRFTRENDRLMVQATGQGKAPLSPSSETDFFVKEANISFTFVRPSATLPATEVVVYQGGQKLSAKRIERKLPTPEQLADYAGDYYSEELGVLYSLFVREGTLRARFPRGEVTLEPVREDLFLGPELGLLRFQRGANGRPSGLMVSNTRVLDLRFRRVDLLKEATSSSPAPAGAPTP